MPQELEPIKNSMNKTSLEIVDKITKYKFLYRNCAGGRTHYELEIHNLKQILFGNVALFSNIGGCIYMGTTRKRRQYSTIGGRSQNLKQFSYLNRLNTEVSLHGSYRQKWAHIENP